MLKIVQIESPTLTRLINIYKEYDKAIFVFPYKESDRFYYSNKKEFNLLSEISFLTLGTINEFIANEYPFFYIEKDGDINVKTDV